jgi:N utilization substance protein A
MKTTFMAAISQLSAERNLPKGVVLAVLESALASAYKRELCPPEQDISVKIDPDVGEVKVYIQKVVAEPVTNPLLELSLAEARQLRNGIQVGEVVKIEATPKNAGRIAAQTARQVISQRLREAEYYAIYEEFVGKEGEIVAGTIQFINPKQIYVGLGRMEAILPFSEQVHSERYRVGQRLKFYLLEITRGTRGPQIIVSRSHPNLLRRLFELEIPEIHDGIVELNAVAREAGYRSKVAVSTRQESIEPVGCCLGPRGIRIQSIVKELNGEKIDIIQWDANAAVFISNALKPAQAMSIELDEAESVATVTVPDRQLSLAIGKEGQNARLAAKLTGWRIDIKSASAAEAEKASLQEVASEEVETVAEEDELPTAVTNEFQLPELVSADKGLAGDEFSSLLEVSPEKPEEKTQIRFAEDILPDRPIAGKAKEGKAKLKKGKVKGKGYKKQISYLRDDDLKE